MIKRKPTAPSAHIMGKSGSCDESTGSMGDNDTNTTVASSPGFDQLLSKPLPLSYISDEAGNIQTCTYNSRVDPVKFENRMFVCTTTVPSSFPSPGSAFTELHPRSPRVQGFIPWNPDVPNSIPVSQLNIVNSDIGYQNMPENRIKVGINCCRVCGQLHDITSPHLYNYTQAVDADLCCTLCRQPLVDPLDTKCGHTFCSPCLKNHLAVQALCPVDKQIINYLECQQASNIVKRLLDKLFVGCPNTRFCDTVICRSNLEEHLRDWCPGTRFNSQVQQQQQHQQQHKVQLWKNNGSPTILEGSPVTIVINRQSDCIDLGFTFVGGIDTPLACILVQEIYLDGPVALDGRLRPGDQLLEINGNLLTNVTHAKARKLLCTHSPVIRLTIFREPVVTNLKENNHAVPYHEEIYTIKLWKRQGKLLGIKLVGKKHMPGLYVLELVSGCEADLDGRIKKDDQILEINNIDLSNGTQEQAAQIINSASDYVLFKVRRNRANTPDILRTVSSDSILDKSGSTQFIPLESLEISGGHKLVDSHGMVVAPASCSIDRNHNNRSLLLCSSDPNNWASLDNHGHHTQDHHNHRHHQHHHHHSLSNAQSTTELLIQSDTTSSSNISNRQKCNLSTFPQHQPGNNHQCDDPANNAVATTITNVVTGNATTINSNVVGDDTVTNSNTATTTITTTTTSNSNNSTSNSSGGTGDVDSHSSNVANDDDEEEEEEEDVDCSGNTVNSNVNSESKKENLCAASNLKSLTSERSRASDQICREERTITVNKGLEEPLGISIAGGRNSQRGDTPVYVTNISPECVLGRSKQVQRGDVLLEANGIGLVGLTHQESVEVLRQISLHHTSIELRVITAPETSNGPENFMPSWTYWLRLPPICQLGKVVRLRRDNNPQQPSSPHFHNPNMSVQQPLGFSIVGGIGHMDQQQHHHHPQQHQQQQIHPSPPISLDISPNSDTGKHPSSMNRFAEFGYTNLYPCPIVIKSIVPGLLAHKDGRLKCGDVILAVNNVSMLNITHSSAVRLLKQTRGDIVLQVISWPGTIV